MLIFHHAYAITGAIVLGKYLKKISKMNGTG